MKVVTKPTYEGYYVRKYKKFNVPNDIIYASCWINLDNPKSPPITEEKMARWIRTGFAEHIED